LNNTAHTPATALIDSSEAMILKAAHNIVLSLAQSIEESEPWSHPEPSALDDAFSYGQVVASAREAATGLRTVISHLEKIGPA